ncbi:MAG: L-2-amino-thiazoline-4-carboxylic acid hydrolase [Planctomycetes bacterium]|nr:L-2-amino-thiazoline-4-carboxylic acid hydrolase [Planctomycetota bacterium]
MNKDQFSIPELSKSGSEWIKTSFPEIRSTRVQKAHSFVSLVSSFTKALQNELGKINGILFMIKTFTIGHIFYKPKWQPELYNFSTKKQKAFYKYLFKKEFTTLIIMFRLLAKKYGEKKADEILANIMAPVTVAVMGKTFTGDDGCTSIQPWWQNGIDYIADLAEDNNGLEGDIYIAKDNSELKWNATKCVLADILKVYGLDKTLISMCMGDHIAAHTLFPGMVFSREHCMCVGDSFCDHHARVKDSQDIGNEDAQFGDLCKIEGGIEFVKQWEDYAKSYYLGSEEKWQEYADNSIKKIRKK